MIEQLPPYDKEEPSMQDGDLYMNRGFGVGNSAERAIEKILRNLLPLASLFAGDEGNTRDNRYLGYFTTHWKRLRGEKVDPMDYDDSAVARIVAQFPELRNEYDSTDLFNMSGEGLLSLTDGSACEQMRLSGRRSMGALFRCPHVVLM